MNEVLKTIKERYSCRDFEDTPLTDGQITAIAEAAAAAPSAMNRQPWRVVIITDKDFIEELDAEGMRILAGEDASGYERIKSRGDRMFYNAPCLIVVAVDGSEYAATDCGILSQNIVLAAGSLGLGSVICGMAELSFTGSRGEEFKQRMRFPAGYQFGLGVLVGTAKSKKPPHQLDMGKITYIRG